MKRYKLLIFIFSLILIACLNNKVTYSYFTSNDKTDIQSVILGNLKIETDNTPENCWRYVPIAIKDNNYIGNDAMGTESLSGGIKVNNLRPGDAFEKDITITNVGSLNSKLKVKKGTILEGSPYKISINLKQNPSNVNVNNDADTWYINNLKTNDKVVFTVRLEIPIDVTNNAVNENNITLSNNALELLDIVATQLTNNTWSE